MEYVILHPTPSWMAYDKGLNMRVAESNKHKLMPWIRYLGMFLHNSLFKVLATHIISFISYISFKVLTQRKATRNNRCSEDMAWMFIGKVVVQQVEGWVEDKCHKGRRQDTKNNKQHSWNRRGPFQLHWFFFIYDVFMCPGRLKMIIMMKDDKTPGTINNKKLQVSHIDFFFFLASDVFFPLLLLFTVWTLHGNTAGTEKAPLFHPTDSNRFVLNLSLLLRITRLKQHWSKRSTALGCLIASTWNCLLCT